MKDSFAAPLQDYETISCMVRETFVKVENRGDRELIFWRADNSYVIFYHEQDCCETVEIVEVIGNLEDLIDTPILVSEERSSKEETNYDSQTWTFYEFRTIKGSVTVRWLGESNGYYSESVYWYDSRTQEYIPREHRIYQ